MQDNRIAEIQHRLQKCKDILIFTQQMRAELKIMLNEAKVNITDMNSADLNRVDIELNRALNHYRIELGRLRGE